MPTDALQTDGLLTKRTKIELGLVLLVVTMAITATTLTTRALIKIESINEDRYTLTQASEDAFRNAIANPGLRFSDPRNPGNYIVVRGVDIIRTPTLNKKDINP